MNRNPKILVIRFSSIGDIILTTPIIRCLNLQLNAEVDILTKRKYKEILLTNSYLRNIRTLSEDTKETITLLKYQRYDFIIDLQNNFRSLQIRLALGIRSYTYSKFTLKRYLLIYFGINLLNNHIVDRYFQSVRRLGVSNDDKGIDYLVSTKIDVKFNIDQDYICWCVGGTYENKKLSTDQILNVVSRLNIPVVFIGGNEDKQMIAKIINHVNSKHIYNFCGQTSIQESAYLLHQSKLVLTNDTGMMHISSAFDNSIIAFWGCTKPSLGFEPYIKYKQFRNIITPLSKRPCSKHGRYCRIQDDGCIKAIKPQIIYETICEFT